MQQGSVIQTSRKEGPDVWQFRWSEKDLNGHRIYRKRVIGTVEQYADAAAVRDAASGLLSDVNLRSRRDRIGSITVDQLCEHFEQSEMRSSANLWSILSTSQTKPHMVYVVYEIQEDIGRTQVFPRCERDASD
jgi:integrase